MAYRCLTQWTTPGGTTYNLSQIDDFTLIPSAAKTATSPYRATIYDNRSTPPSFFSVAGDIIYKSDQMISTSTVFAESEGMRISTGKIDSTNKGVLIYNKISSSDLWKFGLSNVSSSTYRDYKFAVIIDDTNDRTFFLLYVKTVGLGSGYDGHTVYVFSAMYQDVDLFNETFNPVSRVYSNGGGATHIAKRTGQLSNLSSYTSDILIVSGGGGGGLLVGETSYIGKEAGGISGSGDNSANQTTGYAFGQGESGTNASGGGSGLYGGYKGTSVKSGGAGSGYIGNSLLSNKKMVGYNVPTSSAESTKTESVSEASENPVSGKPKIGNGFARIKFLREPSTFSLGNLVKTLDITHKQVTGWDNSGTEDTIITQNLSSYFGTDYILVAQQNNGNYFNTFDGNEGIGHEITMYTGCAIYYPIRPIIATKIKCSSKFDTTGSLSNDSYFELHAGYIENGSMNHITVGSHNKSKEWGIIEKEFDSPVKVEYIEFVVMDNQWHFKDVEITGVLL